MIVKKERVEGQPEQVRICLDGKKLNKYLFSPQNEDLRRRVTGAKVFLQLDLRNAFLTIPLAKEDKKFTAFRYKGRMYQYRRLPFGLVNSMTIFINTMENTLKNLDHCVISYVDDIVVFSKDEETHYKNLDRVLRTLHEAGLTLNLNKSKFMVDQIKFLGYIINNRGIKPNPKKCEGIREFEILCNPTGVKQFLGGVNYFSKHIPNYSQYAGVLTNLTKKNVEWKWDIEEEEAFNKIKELVSREIMNFHSDDELPIEILFTSNEDSYNVAILQKVDNLYRPIAFVGKSFKEVEKRYTPIEREFTAIKDILKRYGYLFHHQKLTIYLQAIWPELLETEPTHSKEGVESYRQNTRV